MYKMQIYDVLWMKCILMSASSKREISEKNKKNKKHINYQHFEMLILTETFLTIEQNRSIYFPFK